MVAASRDNEADDEPSHAVFAERVRAGDAVVHETL
jgi:hypothetical protein